MRRLLVAWCLPLLLLLAQQGALTHEVSHLRSPAGSPQRGGETAKQLAADTLCLSCLSHADLAGQAKAEDFRLPLAEFVHAPPRTPAIVATASQPLAPRSRGPPVFL